MRLTHDTESHDACATGIHGAVHQSLERIERYLAALGEGRREHEVDSIE